MANLWERVRSLEGRTLPTVNRCALFDISKVGEDYVQVVPRSTGKPRRPIKSDNFKRAAELGLDTADVTPDHLRGVGIDEYNRSYIAAIVRAAVEGDASSA